MAVTPNGWIAASETVYDAHCKRGLHTHLHKSKFAARMCTTNHMAVYICICVGSIYAEKKKTHLSCVFSSDAICAYTN